MTPRNSRRSAPSHRNSWHKDIVSYRRARLQRSLTRLCTHPAVNPTGPHGPHGCLPSTRSVASSSLTNTRSNSSRLTSSNHNKQHHSHHVTKGIVPALFDDLVRRQLGIDPSTDNPTASARLTQYLAAARAITSPPSLSDSRFISRIATGIDPRRLKDTKLLSSLVSHPVDVPHQSQRVRDIHLAIRKARERHTSASKREKKPLPSPHSPCPRRSPRKRLRSQNEIIPSSTDEQQGMHNADCTRSGELKAFRPSPESVRRTRSEAARARRSTAKKTPSECCFCPDPQNFEGGEIQSELIGPFVDRRGNAKLFVHFDCACWAPQVYTDPSNGHLRRVYDEYCRGRKLKCSSCGQKGATIGCYIQRCKKVFHYRCLGPAKAHCVERFFAAFCETHAHLGRKPSYKILMEAATIADVSAAQRREDTTYGLDAPHSRYTLLRRRETEVIFSRKWRVASHSGLFDTGKVVFSHRRKAILGKSDRISADDCVRVVKTSALDIASGRLAFMALAQKGDATNDVSAVEARAAIASRESTGLLLLRNLRNSREWKAGDIEIVRSFPIESKQSQVAHRNQQEGSVAGNPGEECVDNIEGKGTTILSGQKRRAAVESENLDGCRDLKKQKVPADLGSCVALGATTSEKLSEALVSRKLPSYATSATRDNTFKEKHRSSSSTGEIEGQKGTTVPLGSHLPMENKISGTHGARGHPTESDHPTDVPLLVLQSVVPQTTCQTETCPHDYATALPKLVQEASHRRSESEGLKAVIKAKSAWEVFLEEQLPRERLLRPDDSKADSLRNMARLWSLLTPVERDSYERRGQVSSLSICDHRKETKVTASRQAEQVNRDAGLFSTASMPSDSIQSRPTIGVKRNVVDEEVRPSFSLRLGKRRRGNFRNDPMGAGPPNWDDLFPLNLDDGLCQAGGCGEIVQTKLERVRSPPPRPKAKS